ncbi:MAG: hypothetical protein AAF609_04240 [Cyanobacteria bacterium P01_C01_bin.120]
MTPTVNREWLMETVPSESSTFLELLVPWDLPIDQHLSVDESDRIDQALQQLLQALESNSPQSALNRIDQAIANLGHLDTQTADVTQTKTSLKPWEVEDYDLYFQTRHVRTKNPAICLVKGLLLTCRCFVEICLQTPHLDAQQIKQQTQGFISYIYLLRRVFDIQTPDLDNL